MSHNAVSSDVPQCALDIGENFLLIEPVGSRVTCKPPPTNTDRDWLVLVETWPSFEADLLARGWALGGSVTFDESTMPIDLKFSSYTHGVENIIATASCVFWNRFLAATHVARHLNLLEKQDRIVLFQAVLYGARHTPHEADTAIGGAT